MDLPHDDAAEVNVLGALMLDPAVIHEMVDLLHPDDFFDARHQRVFAAIVTLAGDSQPVNPMTVITTLRLNVNRSGGIEYISDLPVRCFSVEGIRFYAQEILDHATRRRMIKASQEIAVLAYDVNVSAEDIRAQSEGLVFAATSHDRSSLMPAPISASVSHSLQRYEHMRDNRRVVTGVPSGISRLDYMTMGFQPGELVILAARPSAGKSAMASQIAMLASTILQVPTCFFSLEMTTQSLVDRLMCQVSRISSNNFRHGKISPTDEQKLYSNAEMIRSAQLIIDDQPRMTLSRLRSRARLFAAIGKCELLIVDYLQLIKGDGRKYANKVHEVTDISAELKEIARELNVPVIALSQMSRASEQRADGRPQLSDLRDSGSLEQDSDLVIFLHRPHQGKRDASPKEKSETTLILAKNRNGEIGDVDLHFWADQFYFAEPAAAWRATS